MKRIVTLLLICSSAGVSAQQVIVSQAIISTKTTIISPEEDDNVPPPPPGADGEMRVVRFGGDGETKSTTWLKNDMVKTLINSEMGRTTIIRDNGKKTTTTLLEMMGNKTGFYATDEEQAQMRKQMDSMMQSRRQEANFQPATSTSEILYVDETKKIANYTAKKALLVITRGNGTKDTNTIWYNPDMKLQGIVSTGGMSGFGAFMRNSMLDDLAKINGMILQYETKMARGRKMIVEVTKIETGKEVNDKEFEISKEFDIKPMKDMQNGGNGNFRFRIGG